MARSRSGQDLYGNAFRSVLWLIISMLPAPASSVPNTDEHNRERARRTRGRFECAGDTCGNAGRPKRKPGTCGCGARPTTTRCAQQQLLLPHFIRTNDTGRGRDRDSFTASTRCAHTHIIIVDGLGRASVRGYTHMASEEVRLRPSPLAPPPSAFEAATNREPTSLLGRIASPS